MEIESSRFTCTDGDGNEHIVVEHQELIEHRILGGGVQTVKGLKRLSLLSGGPVNYIDDNTFKIVMTDKIIRRVG